MAPKKIRYQSRSVERHVDRPRDDVWIEIVAIIRDEIAPQTELSVEPPWRFVYELDTFGSALDFWQSTVLIRDDGPTCHVAWGIVFDPEPSGEALAEADRALVTMQERLDTLADR